MSVNNVNVNADPGKITELAAIIRDSYKRIVEETSTLNTRLKTFSNSLDDQTYRMISGKVENLLTKMTESFDSVKTIYKNLIEYAEAVEQAQKELNLD